MNYTALKGTLNPTHSLTLTVFKSNDGVLEALMKTHTDAFYPACTEEEEISCHLLGKCPATKLTRCSFVGMYTVLLCPEDCWVRLSTLTVHKSL